MTLNVVAAYIRYVFYRDVIHGYFAKDVTFQRENLDIIQLFSYTYDVREN